MAPLQDGNIREQRLQEGCCPNCGTRLYKVSHVGGLVMPKMFRKKSSNSANGGSHAPSKMTPLTIPGVAERGQCLKCAAGFPGAAVGGGMSSVEASPSVARSATSGGNASTPLHKPLPTAKAVPAFPSVKAVPVIVTPAPAPTLSEIEEQLKPPPPQSKTESVQSSKQSNSNGDIFGSVNLKQPPETLLGLNNSSLKAPPSYPNMKAIPAYPGNNVHSSIGSSNSDECSSDDSSSSDDDSLEDDLERLVERSDLCRLESDHASSSVVNNLKQPCGYHNSGAIETRSDEDDRKPAAKPLSNNNDAAGGNGGGECKISQQIEESAERIRKLRQEAAAIDMAFLESSTCAKSSPDDHDAALECPLGMSPDVFYELPAEMQKEVVKERESVSSKNNDALQENESEVRFSVGEEEGAKTAADIDPETLASLPDNIRKEVLEQARREQHQKLSKDAGVTAKTLASLPPERPEEALLEARGSQLSRSTADFLHEVDLDEADFAAFPEELKNDILEERRRRSIDPSSQSNNASNDNDDDEDLAAKSGYDPETLASLPEDVRKEVLDQERREREKNRRKKEGSGNKPKSVVGAHSVNVPAGYDPDTFSALPADVQRELLDDAAQQRSYSAEGYDSEGIRAARIVAARPTGGGGGTATSCTYTGEYNIMGKRHGDGELKWANGDKYVGKFKDGYIEGRGTISFHDGTEYSGQWKTNRFHGEGTRRFNNGNVYTGNYESGKRQGQGRCYFANGDMYVGDWKDDTIHGFGRYYYNNGHSFEGMFRNGKRNGRGKYQLTDGRVEIYRYVNDSRVGDGVRWSANRKKAWRMNDGKVTKKVSIEEAATIAKRCGPVVEES